jgi:putative nucleotidyltransferase with HDIG domain
MSDKPPLDPLDAYAGRWIARIRERIVGHGGTPQQALQAAQAARRKETPELLYVPTANALRFSPILDRVQAALPEGQELYLVGGAVRDALMGAQSKDLDFAVPRDALKLARKLADKLEGAYYRLDDEHPTGRVVLVEDDGTRYELDFAEFRGADIDADLRGRDLTINAMAVHVARPEELLDPLGGLNDLFNKQVRHCASGSFTDDPVRTLRAVRFAAAHTFKIEPETRALIKAAAPLLQEVSSERVRDELFKILNGPMPHTAIHALDLLGLLRQVLPELADLRGVTQSAPHISDVWTHSLHTLENLLDLLNMLDENYTGSDEGTLVSGMVALRIGRYRKEIHAHLRQPLNVERPYLPLFLLAALYHDSGKPHTKEAEQDGRIRFIEHERVGAELAEARGMLLHLSNPEIDRLTTIVKFHMRPHFLRMAGDLPSRRAVYRFFRDTGAAGVDICLLSLADLLAIYGHTLDEDTLEKHMDVLRVLLEAYFERREEQVHPPAIIDGNDLMREFDLSPGPQIGELLELVREAQVEGLVKTKGDAYQWVENELQGNKGNL